jgi:hypothetical protein
MRHRVGISLVLCVGACLGTGGCRTVVVEGHWEELANLAADLNVDHASIDIRGDGRWRAVRLEAAGAEMDMVDSRITFGNGEVYDPAVRHHFQEGSWSRRIDLPGGHRHIRKIELWYKAAAPGPGEARIVVWGLR